ncbi:hypothetical protein N7501_007598 [Penicillium viridicatum]|nr:hypothetical protein N7501_007598 [Penicillium viridicatum]
MNRPVQGPSEKRIASRFLLQQRLSEWPDEDWSGISDPRTHRRLQNRLNQRIRQDNNTNAGNFNAPIDQRESSTPSTVSQGNDEVEVLDAPTASERDSLEAIEDVHILECHSPATEKKMALLERIAFHYYHSGSPRTDLLLHLVQLNFTRALIENTRILGLTSDQLHDDAISPFNTAGPWQNDTLHTLPIML